MSTIETKPPNNYFEKHKNWFRIESKKEEQEEKKRSLIYLMKSV